MYIMMWGVTPSYTNILIPYWDAINKRGPFPEPSQKREI